MPLHSNRAYLDAHRGIYLTVHANLHYSMGMVGLGMRSGMRMEDKTREEGHGEKEGETGRSEGKRGKGRQWHNGIT